MKKVSHIGRRPDDEHGAGGIVQTFLGHAAVYPTPDPGPAVSGHDDQIDLVGFDIFENALSGRASHYDRIYL